MAKSELFSTLEDIVFAEKDPEIITSEVISLYETLSGRTLATGDPVRVFLDSIILIIIQQRNFIDRAAKQNLLAYATGAYLEHLAALVGVRRLPASSASTTLRFELSAALPTNLIIPAGTRATPGGNVYFEIQSNSEIPAGDLFIDVEATCTDSGEIGNNYVAGQINKIVDVFPYEMSVSNLTTSTGGADAENDENLRERVMLAPESFSVAGPKGAYKYFAKSAHPDILDTAVITPPDTDPGHVMIVPLLINGEIPSDEILNAVLEKCSLDDVAPDTDYLTVERPEEIFYDIKFSYWIDEKNSAQSYAIQKAVENAVKNFVRWQRLALGRDINPSELNRRILDAGAKRCDIISPSFLALEKYQIAVVSEIDILYAGLEES